MRPVRVDRTGESGPTPRQARGPRWRWVSQGLYVPSSVDADDPQQRVVEAAAAMPRDSAVTGWGAFAWVGARWFDGRDERGKRIPVTLVVPDHRIRPPSGVAISAERLMPWHRHLLDGIVLTDPVRAIAYEMRHAADVRTAVRWADMAAHADLVSIADLRALAANLTAWTGIPQMRSALDFADENAWSPAEVDMRMVWVLDLGLPRPLCNRPVFDLEGRHIGTPDLLDPVAGMAGEYDSALHLEGSQRRTDLEREAAFRRVGLEYVTMVTADRIDPTAFAQRTLEARARALAGSGERAWTIQHPPWWTPTETVAERKRLTESQRARFLRRQAG